MTEQSVTSITGRGLPLPGNDIDTDRIIPARFLRCVTFAQLGEQVFADERFGEDGSPKTHPFNDPRYDAAVLLVVNANFGCGSSREHAPQALKRWGIRAIVGESFAEIFAGNCLNLGLPACTAPREAVLRLQESIAARPETEFTLDLVAGELRFDGTTIELEIEPSARAALLDGSWDSLEVLRRNEERIERLHRGLFY